MIGNYLLGWGVHSGQRSFDYLACPRGATTAPFESGGPDKTLALARITVFHRNYVGGVERGERNIALLNIVALARALKVRPGKLLESIS